MKKLNKAYLAEQITLIENKLKELSKNIDNNLYLVFLDIIKKN